MTTTQMTPAARTWGELWSLDPEAWAANEEQQGAVYEAALGHVPPVAGRRVLDVGCGTGVFLRACADRGADVTGIDASAGLLGLAGERVPEADLRLADMQSLPFEDDLFDVVTGFCAFFYAADMAVALREAARVARPGASVVVEVFGRPERCDIEAVKRAVARFRPAGEGRYWRPGTVEALLPGAGLVLEAGFDVTSAYAFADETTLCDAMTAAGGLRLVAGPEREGELRDAIVEELAGCRTADGGYRLENEWHLVIARAA